MENTSKPWEKDKGSSDKPYKPKYAPDITQQIVLANQTVYEPQARPGANHTHPPYSQPQFIPLDQPGGVAGPEAYPPGFVWDYDSMPWPHSVPLKKRNEIPLQKIYNLNLGNATDKHTMLNTIYEDIIPGDPYTYSMVKINERQPNIFNRIVH